MIQLKVNNRMVETEDGSTILKAAQKLGIFIPTFCSDERLPNRACDKDACRMCSCQVEGAEGLVPACSTPAENGMVVWTESPAVKQARIHILERMLEKHPLDCMNCAKLGQCKLQKFCNLYGVTKPYDPDYSRSPLDESSKFYFRDMDKCIRCGRCVRTCRELVGVGALKMVEENGDLRVRPNGGSCMSETACVNCGNCVNVCPVGAVLPKARVPFRYWQTKRVRSVCPYCGVGCQMDYYVKDGRIVDVKPALGTSNEGLSCVKGKFAYDFINHKDRLTVPLIRRNGVLTEAGWEEALQLVADKLQEVKHQFGPDALAGFASARALNEENYLFQKFMRAAVGTNNVDHCARLCHSSTVAGLAATLGSGAMTNPIPDVKNADVIFVTGSNTTETHPVMGMYIRQAKMAGKKLIVADPKRIPLAEIADIYLQIRPGTSVALSNGMLHVIFTEGLEDKEYIAAHTEGIDELREAVKDCTPERTAEICGVDKQLIIEAARLYASTHKSYIAYAMGITQHLNGSDNVMSMSNLALVTGNLGHSGCGVNPLRGQNNVQGACDMGALPTDYPGYQKVFDEQVQQKFESAWGVKLSGVKGYTVTETMPAILNDKVKLLYIMGENPMVSDPNTNHVREALKKAFVVVQDLFLTETAEYADVVFPSASFAEKTGTFTNTERRVQMVRQAIAPRGQCRADWEILMEVMNRIGYPCHYDSAEDIFNEMRTVTPSYAGMTYARIGAGHQGLCWPCPTEGHPGTPILHVSGPGRKGGIGLLKAMQWIPSPETGKADYPFTLMTGRLLMHYHTRTMTARTPAIHSSVPRNFLEINCHDAVDLGIAEGEWVQVTSPRGSVFVEARIVDTIDRGVLWMPFHYADGANVLVDSEQLDPVAKIPGFKQVGVKLAKVDAQTVERLKVLRYMG